MKYPVKFLTANKILKITDENKVPVNDFVTIKKLQNSNCFPITFNKPISKIL